MGENAKPIWRSALWLTLLIEGITAMMRFGCDLQSTRDTAVFSHLTFGIRIHHSYIGVVLGLFGWVLLKRRPELRRWTVALAAALVASDLIHHFIVLWIFVGDPEFHLTYPGGSRF